MLEVTAASEAVGGMKDDELEETSVTFVGSALDSMVGTGTISAVTGIALLPLLADLMLWRLPEVIMWCLWLP